MSRIPLIAGNWKMNKTMGEAEKLAAGIVDAERPDDIEVALCPPFVSLPAVRATVEGSPVATGAQNCHWETSGAYTGEVAAPMLVGLADYVIIGHSERRQYFGETDETVNRKAHAILAAGLRPIICIGESLAQNQAGETGAVVSSQTRAAFAGLTAAQAATCVVAYEPIWAIGTGLTATGPDANAVCAEHVRAVLADLFGAETASAIRILYGGSVKPGNTAEFAAQPDIDGALVGGASLSVGDFVGIITAWASAG